jgi:pimeloyl-ACP methyl ester carboxylesterase
VPVLFLQGARDELAQRELLQSVVERIRQSATLRLFDDADHSFHVPARSGRKDAEVLDEVLDALADWIDGVMRR